MDQRGSLRNGLFEGRYALRQRREARPPCCDQQRILDRTNGSHCRSDGSVSTWQPINLRCRLRTSAAESSMTLWATIGCKPFSSPGTTRSSSVTGPEDDCLPKPSGNSRHAPARRVRHTAIWTVSPINRANSGSSSAFDSKHALWLKDPKSFPAAVLLNGNGPHPGAQKRMNAWGVYDMLGNVWEWVEDRYGPYQPSRRRKARSARCL